MSNIENNPDRQDSSEQSISPEAGRDYIRSRTEESESRLYKFLDSKVPIRMGAAGAGVAGLLFIKISESLPVDMRIGSALAIAGLSIGYLKLLWDKYRQDSIAKSQQKESENG